MTKLKQALRHISNFLDSLQQNNKNQNMFAQSPTYQSASHSSKNNRLHNQLLQSNYLSDHIYNSSTNASSSAAIKFVAPLTLPQYKPNLIGARQTNDPLTKSPRWNCVFKSADGTKNSNQMTLSFPSNYSIVEIENQSQSTINLYNLSRNNIEHDLSISSSDATAKLHHQNSHIFIPNKSKPSLMLLQKSANTYKPQLQQRPSLQPELYGKMHKSEEQAASNDKEVNQQQENEIDSSLPKISANNSIKKELSCKFSSQNKSQAELDNFKAVLNQIHFSPQKVSKEIQAYVFSPPVNEKIKKQLENRSKITIINKQYSKQSIQRTNKILQFHNNPQHINLQSARFHNHISIKEVDSHYTKEVRQTPKSEGKPHYISNQKTTRSNSIGCKAKTHLSLVKQRLVQSKPQKKLQQSQVGKFQKLKGQQSLELNSVKVQNSSVIYEQSQVNLCCDTTNHQKQTNANPIIFKNKNQQSNIIIFDSKQSMDSSSLNRSKRGNPCYINPLKIIKSYNENRESESQKKGIKLVGFNSSFPKKSEE